jgi:S1-C subfamily serine protease
VGGAPNSRKSAGKYYAISSKRVQAVLPDLIAGKSQDNIGWDLAALPRATIRERLGFDIAPYRAGLVVLGTTLGSPAAAAGFAPNEVVVQIGEQPVASFGDVCGILKSTQPGSTVPVVVRSGSRGRPGGVTRHLRVP